MATAAEESRCPICLDAFVNKGYVMPCLHEFCFECIKKWIESTPKCPLCKSVVGSIVHSVRDDNNFEELFITLSSGMSERASGHPIYQPQAVIPWMGGPVGDFQPQTWAYLFSQYPSVLQPLMPWLRRELWLLLEGNGMVASETMSLITARLCFFGLSESALTEMLHSCLRTHTVNFVRRLIATAVLQCSREAYRVLGLEPPNSCYARYSASSSVGGHAHALEYSGISEGSSIDELPSTSTAHVHGASGCPPSIPIPNPEDQEVNQEEEEEADTGSSSSDEDEDH